MPTRSLSPRNPFLGYECGRVFPAGEGPDSPSKVTPSGCFHDLDGRLRRGSGLVVEEWCPLGAPPSSELQFGALREEVARERQEILSRKTW